VSLVVWVAGIGLAAAAALSAALVGPSEWQLARAVSFPGRARDGGALLALHRRERRSPEDQRRARAIVNDLRVTRTAAVAYFAAEGGGTDHAREIDDLVDGALSEAVRRWR
jgi:hypothetical protein